VAFRVAPLAFGGEQLQRKAPRLAASRLPASERSSCAVVKVTAQRGETFIIPNNFVPNRTILYLTAMLISDKYFNTIYQQKAYAVAVGRDNHLSFCVIRLAAQIVIPLLSAAAFSLSCPWPACIRLSLRATP
jgi:hypothetical protein